LSQYSRAGVNIDAGQKTVELMAEAIKATYGPEVLSNTQSFGGLYDISGLSRMSSPVLVASTDGVGTKTKVAARLDRWDTIGHDIVNHCVNDILVQGARPLFFLDYVASARLVPEQIAAVVRGIAEACRAAGCALLGGETAEMRGVYQPGEIDLVGTIIGVVEKDRLIDGKRIGIGDVIIGLPSRGLHTNGYSLARVVLEDLNWLESIPELGCSVGEVLLIPHRSYLDPVLKLWDAGVDIRGLAHITGGGLLDNLPRILPADVGAVIRRGTWPELPIFNLIQWLGQIDELEMFRVFNMGLGMLVVIPADQADLALQSLPGESFLVGETAPPPHVVAITHEENKLCD
jgi:phosphoribosylformylglycinamidine cyclo-ligase